MSNKESIHLRKRKHKSGNTALYLDIYRNGVRKYEHLKLYLIPEHTKNDKDINRQTLQLAETIKAKRTVELHNEEYGFKTKREQVRFFDFFQTLIYQDGEGITRSAGCAYNWVSTYKYLRQYESRDITISEITPKWVDGFKRFLEKKAVQLRTKASKHRSKDETPKPLSQNSKHKYFTKLRAAINMAVKRGIIKDNSLLEVRNFAEEETEREYLTIEEIKKLTITPCEYDSVRRAFLFSCLTGMRISDIRKIKWGDVQQLGDMTRIVFRQQKTKGQEYLDINYQAAEFMGERQDPSRLVFDDLPSYNQYSNACIKRWVKRAGINKNITFHCARHSFAVMMLDIGTDIYTVSKLLGHRELSTTQIYAKVLDKNKQKAVQNIPSIFG